MELKRKPYIVYVKINSNKYITDVKSSAFLSDTNGWIEIDSGNGYEYHHAQNNYFPKPIYTKTGAYRYKLDGGIAVECTADEISEQEEANKPEPIVTTDDVLNVLLGVSE